MNSEERRAMIASLAELDAKDNGPDPVTKENGTKPDGL